MQYISTFVELSIAIMAFTSIVIQFKSTQDKDFNTIAFQGILFHNMIVFCSGGLLMCLDSLEITSDLPFTILSFLLAFITLAQGVVVFLLDKISSKKSKLSLILVSTVTSTLLILKILSILPYSLYGYFGLVLFWHLLQSLFIFFSMISKAVSESTKN